MKKNGNKSSNSKKRSRIMSLEIFTLTLIITSICFQSNYSKITNLSNDSITHKEALIKTAQNKRKLSPRIKNNQESSQKKFQEKNTSELDEKSIDKMVNDLDTDDPELLKSKLQEFDGLSLLEGKNQSVEVENHKMLNLQFISNLELRYLLDVIKNSEEFTKLFPKAKNIIERETQKKFDYTSSENHDFHFNLSKPELFQDSNSILSIKGLADVMIVSSKQNFNSKNITKSKSSYESKSVWLVSNSNVLVAYENREFLNIIFQIKKNNLKIKEIYTSPCIVIFDKTILRKVNQSYLICFNSIEARNIWTNIIGNKNI